MDRKQAEEQAQQLREQEELLNQAHNIIDAAYGITFEKKEPRIDEVGEQIYLVRPIDVKRNGNVIDTIEKSILIEDPDAFVKQREEEKKSIEKNAKDIEDNAVKSRENVNKVKADLDSLVAKLQPYTKKAK